MVPASAPWPDPFESRDIAGVPSVDLLEDIFCSRGFERGSAVVGTRESPFDAGRLRPWDGSGARTV